MRPFLDSAIRLDNIFLRMFYNKTNPFILYCYTV